MLAARRRPSIGCLAIFPERLPHRRRLTVDASPSRLVDLLLARPTQQFDIFVNLGEFRRRRVEFGGDLPELIARLNEVAKVSESRQSWSC